MNINDFDPDVASRELTGWMNELREASRMIIPGWALNEWVTVTAVQDNMVLIQRATGTGAITVEATGDGALMVNGMDVMGTETAERVEHLCGVTDSVLAGVPIMGRTVSINAAEAAR